MNIGDQNVKCFERTKKSFYKTKIFSLLELKKRKKINSENKIQKKRFIQITSETTDISRKAHTAKRGTIGKYAYKVIKYFLQQIN